MRKANYSPLIVHRVNDYGGLYYSKLSDFMKFWILNLYGMDHTGHDNRTHILLFDFEVKIEL